MRSLQESLNAAEAELTRLSQETTAAETVLNGKRQAIDETEQQLAELEWRHAKLAADVKKAAESARNTVADANAVASRCVDDARAEAKAILDNALAKVAIARDILGEKL